MNVHAEFHSIGKKGTMQDLGTSLPCQSQAFGTLLPWQPKNSRDLPEMHMSTILC